MYTKEQLTFIKKKRKSQKKCFYVGIFLILISLPASYLPTYIIESEGIPVLDSGLTKYRAIETKTLIEADLKKNLVSIVVGFRKVTVLFIWFLRFSVVFVCCISGYYLIRISVIIKKYDEIIETSKGSSEGV